MPERVRDIVACQGAAACLVTRDATWSYDELWRHSGRMAAALRAAGAAAGDRVAAMVDKSPFAIALYLGCLRAGAVYLPLNPAYTDAEAAAIVSDAGALILVTSPARADGLGRRVSRDLRVMSLDADGAGSLVSAGADPAGTDPAGDALGADVARAASDPAAMLYTSGTTGRPKGVVLSHRNLTANADVLVDAWRFTADDVLLHALPIFHVHGLFVALHCALFAGAAVRLLERFDAAQVVAELPGSTVFMGVPTFYSRLLDQPGLDRACGSMRLFTSGSAPLSPATHEAFAGRTGHAILERYGMTEAGMITSNPYDGERVPGSVGYPLDGVEVRIGPADGSPSFDDVGVLEIRGPSVFAGYWHRPEADREAFRHGWLVTGDLVRRDPDGRLWIIGRAKDLIISGGMNVYPAEVENAIDALPGVGSCAVIGVPHPDFGEAVVAVVEGGEPMAADAVERLARLLGQRLAGYKRPKRWLFLDTLPRNALGKVQKSDLRERFNAVFGEPASARNR